MKNQTFLLLTGFIILSIAFANSSNLKSKETVENDCKL